MLWTLFAIALVVHLLGLYLPGGTGGPAFFEGEDKLGHMAIFAVVVAPALLLGFPARLVCVLAAAHAALSELIQHTLIPRRSGELLDFVADCVGVLVGVLIARWVRLASGRFIAGEDPPGSARFRR